MVSSNTTSASTIYWLRVLELIAKIFPQYISLTIAYMQCSRRAVDMKLVSFRILFITVTCVLSVSKSTQAELDEVQRSPVVQTESGAVVGKIETLPHGKSVHEYLGIPYAEPPLGELRFAAPKPVKAWSGTKHATEFGASCVQPTLPGVPGVCLIVFKSITLQLGQHPFRSKSVNL